MSLMLRTYFYLIIVIFLLFCEASAKDYWGSIYINEETGIAGGGINYDTEKESEQIAISQCNKKHGKRVKCIVALTFYNSCGAVAWSKNKKMAGGGWHGDSLSGAQKAALKRCKFKGADDCKMIQSFCTSWETYEWW